MPGMIQSVKLAVRGGAILPPRPPDGSGRVAAVSAHLARHPLQDSTLGRTRQEEVVVRVAVDVHEAWGSRQALGADPPVRCPGTEITAHGDKPATVYGEIAFHRRRSTSVVNLRPANQDVKD